MQVRVAWSLINYGPIWAPAYASHLRAMGVASRELAVCQLGGVYACGATDRAYTHTAENQVVRNFLDTDCTHLFMTENDMILPDRTLPLLLEVGQPAVSGVYFLRGGHGQPCLYTKAVGLKGSRHGRSPVTLFPQDHPFELKDGCAGLGCLLLAREVLEAMAFPWFDLKEGEGGYGSDMFFSSKLADAGYTLWVHPGVACDQIDYEVVGLADYQRRLADDEHFARSGYIVGLHHAP